VNKISEAVEEAAAYEMIAYNHSRGRVKHLALIRFTLESSNIICRNSRSQMTDYLVMDITRNSYGSLSSTLAV
jgi:hypothetical protein